MEEKKKKSKPNKNIYAEHHWFFMQSLHLQFYKIFPSVLLHRTISNT